jgi:hypothetical protein
MDTIVDIMFACCILHNMILDDEHDASLELPFDLDQIVPLQRGLSFEDLVSAIVEIENLDLHFNLRGDLIEHNWALKGATCIDNFLFIKKMAIVIEVEAQSYIVICLTIAIAIELTINVVFL